MQAFLAGRDIDADSQAAVYNLDHGALQVLSTLEALALRPHELTHAGFVLLMTLWITGSRETRELASILRVTRGAIVGAVNTLERRALVRRLRSKIDRRLVTVELTDEGRDLVARVQLTWHALEREVTAELTPEEKRTLAALCRKMVTGAVRLRLSRNGAARTPEPGNFLRNTEKRQPNSRPTKHHPGAAARRRDATTPR